MIFHNVWFIVTPHSMLHKGLSDWFCPSNSISLSVIKNISEKDFLIFYTSCKHIKKLEISQRKTATYLGVANAVHCMGGDMFLEAGGLSGMCTEGMRESLIVH